MNTAHDYLAEIARAGAGRFASTSLASSHAGVTLRVRRHRTARAAVTTVAGIGVIGGATWGGLEAFERGNAVAPGLPASSAATPSGAPTAPADECAAAALLITDATATAYPNGDLPAEVLCSVNDGWGTVTVRGDAGVALESTLRRMRDLGATGAMLNEGYRDLETQARIAAKRGYLAPSVGSSALGTGLAINLAGDAPYDDFATVAADFGWVRNLDSEPWHFEYQPGTSDEGTRVEQRMTIPGGNTFAQVSARLADAYGVSTDDAAAAIDAAVRSAVPQATTSEGWVKPGQYTLEAGETLSEAAAALVGVRVAEFTSLAIPADQWQEVLTEASLVEREAKLDIDKPKVARVIQNRLDQGMKLELDSTVLYVAPGEGVFTTDEQRATDSPYNTYLYQGLPPGAIGSPSDISVNAVLRPADGDLLYFVTVNPMTGEMAYASTYPEHLQNVQKLRDWIDANADS